MRRRAPTCAAGAKTPGARAGRRRGEGPGRKRQHRVELRPHPRKPRHDRAKDAADRARAATPRETPAATAAAVREWRAEARRRTGGDRLSRCESARRRQGADSRRRTGRSSCRRGMTGNDRSARRHLRSSFGRSRADPSSNRCAREGYRAHRPASHRSGRSRCRDRNARKSARCPRARAYEGPRAPRPRKWVCTGSSHAVVHAAEIQHAARIETRFDRAAEPQLEFRGGLKDRRGGPQRVGRPHRESRGRRRAEERGGPPPPPLRSPRSRPR